MGTPVQPPPVKRSHFLIEIWNENREAFKALLTDAFLISVVLGILFFIFLQLQAMEKAGYPHESIERFLTFHDWGYNIVLVIILVDLIMRIFTLLILRRTKP